MEEKNVVVKSDNKKPLKLFLIFLSVVIVLVTIYMVIKRQSDIDKGTTPSDVPNQAVVK